MLASLDALMSVLRLMALAIQVGDRPIALDISRELLPLDLTSRLMQSVISMGLSCHSD
jgi:hypothetical protein